jgi:hypothetical protein
MPRVEDVTADVLANSSQGPGDHVARVVKAKPAKTLTPTLQATLDEWNRKSDRSVGRVSKALAYGFHYIKPSTHSNMIRLIKGGHLKVCEVRAKPPAGSNAHRGAPFGDSYYLIRPNCPSEVSEGTLYGASKRKSRRARR